MKYLNIVDNFITKLEKNPTLMPHSINSYSKIIRELVEKYGIDPSVEQLNEFIAYKCKKRQPTAKYAIKHYLDFRWRKNIYSQLIKAKQRPIKIKKNYVNKQEALQIISGIKNPTHRVIAKIGYYCGTRPSETITIKKSEIYKENEHNRIRIDITGKGDKRGSIYLNDEIYLDLQPFLISDGEYLFIKKKPEEQWSEYTLMVKTQSVYKRYYESLKKSGDELGISISPHDWRRSFAQSLRDIGFDILDVKKSLRHKNIETTERYFQDDPERIAKAMLKHQQGIQ